MQFANRVFHILPTITESLSDSDSDSEDEDNHHPTKASEEDIKAAALSYFAKRAAELESKLEDLERKKQEVLDHTPAFATKRVFVSLTKLHAIMWHVSKCIHAEREVDLIPDKEVPMEEPKSPLPTAIKWKAMVTVDIFDPNHMVDVRPIDRSAKADKSILKVKNNKQVVQEMKKAEWADEVTPEELIRRCDEKENSMLDEEIAQWVYDMREAQLQRAAEYGI